MIMGMNRIIRPVIVDILLLDLKEKGFNIQSTAALTSAVRVVEVNNMPSRAIRTILKQIAAPSAKLSRKNAPSVENVRKAKTTIRKIRRI
jgi:hypothetical protein